jgi:hypothetical protein
MGSFWLRVAAFLLRLLTASYISNAVTRKVMEFVALSNMSSEISLKCDRIRKVLQAGVSDLSSHVAEASACTNLLHE